MIIGDYIFHIWYDRDHELNHRGTTIVTVYKKEDFLKVGSKIKDMIELCTPIATGKSICGPKDHFIRRRGILIAANRALKVMETGEKFKWNGKEHSYELRDKRDVLLAGN